MELYLVQHGEAVSKEVDPNRPLTEPGRAEVLRVARTAHAAGVRVAAVCHSGRLRAQQTAEIFSAELQVEETPTVLAGLSPNDDPHLVGGALDSLSFPALLVGHLPHISRLCSLIITGRPDLQIAQFRMGGIVTPASDDSHAWAVSWMLTPDIVAPG
jgi:phosphohistidine phosphatase